MKFALQFSLAASTAALAPTAFIAKPSTALNAVSRLDLPILPPPTPTPTQLHHYSPFPPPPTVPTPHSTSPRYSSSVLFESLSITFLGLWSSYFLSFLIGSIPSTFGGAFFLFYPLFQSAIKAQSANSNKWEGKEQAVFVGCLTGVALGGGEAKVVLEDDEGRRLVRTCALADGGGAEREAERLRKGDVACAVVEVGAPEGAELAASELYFWRLGARMGDYMDLEIEEWEGVVDEFEDVGRWEYGRWRDRVEDDEQDENEVIDKKQDT